MVWHLKEVSPCLTLLYNSNKTNQNQNRELAFRCSGAASQLRRRHVQWAGRFWGRGSGALPRRAGRARPSGRRHVTEQLLLPSVPVARAEVNTRTSSGRVLAFPLPSPQLGGRDRLFSGPGLCPGFPPSRAGRQGGRRRANCQESSRKSGRQLFASLTEVRSAGRRGSRRELFEG